jgi:phage terminase large subunit
MSEIRINNKYSPLWKDKSRYFVITGGRGSSKSFSVALFLLNLTYEEGHKVLFTRYTLVSAQTSIIPEFIEKIEIMDAHKDFRILRDEIINLKTKSSIMFKGIRTSSGNQTAALKSLQGVTTFVLDEAEELEEEKDFDKIDFSIRSKLRQNRVILVMNPATKEHWIYRRFFLNTGIEAGSNTSKNDVTYIHTTFLDNIENLSESYVDQIYDLKRRDINKYDHIIQGGWLEKSEGTIIRNWKVGEFIPSEKMCYGQDFGFSLDNSTLVKVSVDVKNRRCYVKEMFGRPNLSTAEIARLNLKHAGNDLIICDNSEPRLTEELKRAGCNIRKTIKKKGTILSGIALMQDFEIIVHPSSDNIKREFNNYIWHEHGLKPIDKWNHFVDAIRYALMYLVQGKSSGVYNIL